MFRLAEVRPTVGRDRLFDGSIIASGHFLVTERRHVLRERLGWRSPAWGQCSVQRSS